MLFLVHSIYGKVQLMFDTKQHLSFFVYVVLQLGTLGAGNHYAEIQVVDEIYNSYAAKRMGIDFKGQVCVMIHCGSRGLGHQVATGKYKLRFISPKDR